MADSDEGLTLGTPFEELEDDAPRKKPVPIHEQIVTDSRGRRRFHGAFTGGFSAGYFNTVDTKEGWTPKSFVSSRSQKAPEFTAQRPEDFMDEEDLGEFGIAPKRVVTTEKFLSSDKEKMKAKRVLGPMRPSDAERGVSRIIEGSELLQDLIVPVRMSVGVKLLSQMGWKEGQGIGPRVRRVAKKTYGCAYQSTDSKDEDNDIYAVGLFFAPKDVKSVEYASKDNLHGIGYSGINPKTALLNQRDWLGLDPSTAGIQGHGFGVGALEEEDDDIYSQDNMSNYDIDLNLSSSRKKNELHGWTGPPQSSEQGGLLSVFTKVSRPPSRKVYPPPVVPRDFVPVHKINAEKLKSVAQSQFLSTPKTNNEKLTAKERGEALGEIPLPNPRKSVFDYIQDKDKTRLKESRERGKATQQVASTIARDDKGLAGSNTRDNRGWDNKEMTGTNTKDSKGLVFKSSGFKPFAKDPDKQARYELFLSGKHSQVNTQGNDSKMTEWERECEAEEFARAASLYRPLNQTMAARFTSAKESDDSSLDNKETGLEQTKAPTRIFGSQTRQRFEWHPDRVLCKRFNIPNPYPGSDYTGVPIVQKAKATLDEKLDKEIKAIENKPANDTKNEELDEGNDKTSALITGFQAMAARKPVVPVKESSTQNEAENADAEDENVIKLADMDLFKAVFAESSSESDSEESDKAEEGDKAEDSKNEEVITNVGEDDDVQSKTSGSKLDKTDDIKLNDSHRIISEGSSKQQNQHPDSNEPFGPTLPSAHELRPSLGDSRNFEFEEKRERKQKNKRKKKKKEKSKKYKETDSDNDSEYEQYKKYKKRNKGSFSEDSDDDYKNKTKSKKKIRTKYSDSEDSDNLDYSVNRAKTKERLKDTDSGDSESEKEYRKRDKHKKKKEKKSKEGRKHKVKKRDKTEKHRHSKDEFDWDDYEEKTYENVASHSKNDERHKKSHTETNKLSRVKEDYDDSRIMDKDIVSKLKNIQMLKEGRRMRAADFM